MDNKVGRRRKSPIVQHLNDYSLKTCQTVQALPSNLDKREFVTYMMSHGSLLIGMLVGSLKLHTTALL